MAYRFLENVAVADMAFEVRADTLSHLFSEAAEAFLSAHVSDPQSVERTQRVRVEVGAPALDLLLYRFLQELVYYKDVNRWLLHARQVSIQRMGAVYRLTARMAGETLDPARHEQRADVKAVTLHRLEVRPAGRGWRATVVVDV